LNKGVWQLFQPCKRNCLIGTSFKHLAIS
jgi:hypothetical protein